MNVKRYDYNPYRQYVGEQFNGPYVTYADYARLAKLYEAAWEELICRRELAANDHPSESRASRMLLPHATAAHDALRKEAGL